MRVNGFFPIIADLAHYLLNKLYPFYEVHQNFTQRKKNPVHIWNIDEFHFQTYNQKALKDSCSPAALNPNMLVKNCNLIAG